jgi:hypothetical protein
MAYPRIQVFPRTGTEPFTFRARALPISILDFWRWSASDLLNSATRGVLAEFIVSRALGIERPAAREAWAPRDLTTPAGIKVEVISASYIQSWHQERLSGISFLTPKAQAWDSNTSQQSSGLQQAEVVVFALLNHRDQATINPLDLTQWLFWAVPIATLQARGPGHSVITLPSLLALAGEGLDFHSIRRAVARACPSRLVLGIPRSRKAVRRFSFFGLTQKAPELTNQLPGRLQPLRHLRLPLALGKH